MTSLLRKLSFWLACTGLTTLVIFVRANTAVLPMAPPPATPPEKPFRRGIGASGLVEGLRENTSIGVPFAGLVSEVRVKVSQRVKRGDVLLVLDDRERRVQLTSLQAELKVREAELRRAQRQYDRMARIGAGPIVTQEDLEKREDDLGIAKAMVEKARASITEAGQQLDRFLVRAPIDATVLQVNLRAGENASPGSITAPLVLGSIDELQIRADVDEQLAPRVREGAKAVAYRKGETSQPIPLVFERIEPFIVPKKSLTGSSIERVDTRVLPVIFRFTSAPTLKTYVGQQVDVFIEE